MIFLLFSVWICGVSVKIKAYRALKKPSSLPALPKWENLQRRRHFRHFRLHFRVTTLLAGENPAAHPPPGAAAPESVTL
nr:hypothetical protein [uncultured Agathobaculum sp.]